LPLSLRQSVAELCQRELATGGRKGLPSFPGGTKREDQKGDEKAYERECSWFVQGCIDADRSARLALAVTNEPRKKAEQPTKLAGRGSKWEGDPTPCKSPKRGGDPSTSHRRAAVMRFSPDGAISRVAEFARFQRSRRLLPWSRAQLHRMLHSTPVANGISRHFAAAR
jgi:hypothetical protein